MLVQKLREPQNHTAEVVKMPRSSKAERELQRRHYCITDVAILNLRLVITEHDFAPFSVFRNLPRGCREFDRKDAHNFASAKEAVEYIVGIATATEFRAEPVLALRSYLTNKVNKYLTPTL